MQQLLECQRAREQRKQQQDARDAVSSATTNFFFNVLDYGADPTGVADSTSNIQAAINAAIAVAVRGACVLLPAGIYKVGGTLTIASAATTATIELRGATPGNPYNPTPTTAGTYLVVPSGFAGDTIVATNAQAPTIRSLTITSVSPRAAGRAIYLDNTTNAVVEDVHMLYQYTCLEIRGGTGHRILRGQWNLGTHGYGLRVRGDTVSTPSTFSNDTYVTQVYVNGGDAGYSLECTGATYMHQCSAAGSAYGLLISPTSNQIVEYCFFSSCAFDSTSLDNVRITSTGTGAVRSLTFVECWTASLSAGGFGNCFVIIGNTDGVQLIGHRFLNNTIGNGLYVSGSTVKHVYVDACVAAGITVGTGFLFLGNTTEFAVRNCHSGIYGGFPANYIGIQVLSGCSRYMISGCICSGNTLSNLLDNGAAPKVVVASSNLLI